MKSKVMTIANHLVKQGASSVGQPLRHFVRKRSVAQTRSPTGGDTFGGNGAGVDHREALPH